jgi:hypothetical protein
VKANDVTLRLLNREMLNLAPAARPKLAAGAFIAPVLDPLVTVLAPGPGGSPPRSGLTLSPRVYQNDRCTAGRRSPQCQLWVIRDRGGRSLIIVHVRFAPKADK